MITNTLKFIAVQKNLTINHIIRLLFISCAIIAFNIWIGKNSFYWLLFFNIPLLNILLLDFFIIVLSLRDEGKIWL